MVVSVLRDIINISHWIEIPMQNINFDMWNILVVIVLYIFTYEILDKRENKRRNN